MRRSVSSLSLAILAFAACKSDSNDPSAGPPTALLVLAGGTPQFGVFGQPVAVAPTILVTDANNRPVPGVAVAFAITKGGGSVNAPSQTTGANGNASVAWTMGNIFGANLLTATVAGLSPAVFSANANAPSEGVVAFSLTDPAGDTLTFGVVSGPTGIDLLSVRGDYKSDSLIVTATFTAPVVLGTNVANGLYGWIVFDIDDNAATGLAYTNEFGGSANLGIEYELDFYSSPTSMFFHSLTSPSITVAASASGNTVIARIPMASVGSDDGNFSIGGVIGTRDRPTDIFPNAGQTAVRRDFGIASTENVVTDAGRIAARRRGTIPRTWRERGSPFNR